MQIISKIIFFIILFSNSAFAQSKFQSLVQSQALSIIKPSVKTAPNVIDVIQTFDSQISNNFLLAWKQKKLWYQRNDNSIFFVKSHTNSQYYIFDLVTNKNLGLVEKNTLKQIKPNSGVRKLIGSALVTSQLNSHLIKNRISSLENISRNPKAIHLNPLREALSKESDENLKIQMLRLERLLTVKYEINETIRKSAILSFANDLSLYVRATLNPILNTTIEVSQSPPKPGTYADIIDIENFSKLNRSQAYEMIVSKGWADKDISEEMKRSSLIKNIKNGEVSGIKIKNLNTEKFRELAY